MVNGVIIFPTNTSISQTILSRQKDTLSIAILNGNILTLEDANLGFYVEGAEFQTSYDFQIISADKSFVWSDQKQFHPSDTQKKPLSLLHVGEVELEKCASGMHEGQIRVKSRNHPEIVQTFTLEVK